MSIIHEDIRKWLSSSGVLYRVGKPVRYIGRELNSTIKDFHGKLRVLLAFPDTYEVGMSHLGLKLLYRELNGNSAIFAERTYLPWIDMIEEMKRSNIPLFSLETLSPARDFHVIGITLQYELVYTNVLALLDLAGIPILRKDRSDEPLVIGGGPCASNPEPMSDFFDAFVIGDGEVVMQSICEIVKENINMLVSGNREELLEIISSLQGVYVPALSKRKVVKSVISSISDLEIDRRPVVPFMKVVHDRSIIEVMRGCNRGCRFCQAGMLYRPVRERSPEGILESVEEILHNTGYEEVSLLSLSTMDYSRIEELTDRIMPILELQKVALSLPSSRIDAFGVQVASKIASIRKTGLTFAPEAGTQRLRNVINKNVTERDLLDSARVARENGWQRLKLYFMMGLPTETDEDIEAIVKLGRKVKAIGFKELSISVALFIPKPHTPFQFARQIDEKEARRKAEMLRTICGRGIQLKVHNSSSSKIEGVLSRGDRSLGEAIYEAYKMGAIFDEWEEQFNPVIWEKAFSATGIVPERYSRGYGLSEELPWEVVDTGVSKTYLIDEYLRAMKEKTTPDCRWNGCTGCCVCQTLQVSNRVYRV